MTRRSNCQIPAPGPDDGNLGAPTLCVEYDDDDYPHERDWIVLPIAAGFGTKLETWEFDLNGNTPTGRFEVRGVEPNGSVDGLAFGLFWKDAMGDYRILRSNTADSNPLANFVGAWPLSNIELSFTSLTSQITSNEARRQAKVALLGAKLLDDGTYAIGTRSDHSPDLFDFNNDCMVGVQDFLALLGVWGPYCSPCPECPQP